MSTGPKAGEDVGKPWGIRTAKRTRYIPMSAQKALERLEVHWIVSTRKKEVITKIKSYRVGYSGFSARKCRKYVITVFVSGIVQVIALM